MSAGFPLHTLFVECKLSLDLVVKKLRLLFLVGLPRRERKSRRTMTWSLRRDTEASEPCRLKSWQDCFRPQRMLAALAMMEYRQACKWSWSETRGRI